MDVVSDVLDKIKLSSAVYFKSDFPSPWGMDISSSSFAQFHIVTRGQCVLASGNRSIQLFAGDIVVFPKGAEHWLADIKVSERKDGGEVVKAIARGESLFCGDVIATTLICGHFEFNKEYDHPLMDELPEIIHISNTERREFPWLESVSDLLIQEIGSQQFASGAVTSKLGEILFSYALRAYINRGTAAKGFLAAIRDIRMGEVLKAVHRMPDTDWKLADLAQIAGMSRTSFSNQFKLLMGITPLNYITLWRILKAKELLTESKKPIGQIACEVGYQSEAAFNRIFKKRTAFTPLKFRQSLEAAL